MSMVKLPQPYALRLEVIRAKGFSDREMLELLRRLDSRELQEKVNSELKWDSFLDYVQEQWETVKTAVLEGYRFSFITIGGLKSLLSIRFQKAEGEDYFFTGNRIEQLKLNAADLQLLRSLVPEMHWNFIKTETDSATGTTEIRIELVTASPIRIE